MNAESPPGSERSFAAEETICESDHCYDGLDLYPLHLSQRRIRM